MLLKAILLKNVTGHFRWEMFFPGDYYGPDADAYHWLRVELLYRF